MCVWQVRCDTWCADNDVKIIFVHSSFIRVDVRSTCNERVRTCDMLEL